MPRKALCPAILFRKPFLAKPLRSVSLSTGAIPCKTAPFRVRITKYQSGGRVLLNALYYHTTAILFLQKTLLLQYLFCKKCSCYSTHCTKAAVSVPFFTKTRNPPFMMNTFMMKKCREVFQGIIYEEFYPLCEP